MQATQQTATDQNRQVKQYEPNEQLLETLQELKLETNEQSDYYRGQLEAIFEQRRAFG